MDFINHFLGAFVPLFVAVDAIGMVGVYLGLTSGLTISVKKRLVTEATLTALGISLIFLAFGKMIFRLLGINENDFRVAGGLILLVLAIWDLLFSQQARRKEADTSVGVVPIGIPLIMGPAALTTIMLSVESSGFYATLLALILNLIIVWVIFRKADEIVKLMGDAGARAVAKVMALFLAAIAIMMIRVGIEGFISSFSK